MCAVIRSRRQHGRAQVSYSKAGQQAGAAIPEAPRTRNTAQARPLAEQA
jgi:hypothetical protein